MLYRYLGKSGLSISPLTLGTMMFGGQTDEAQAHRIIHDAREKGINSIDTADIYNGGESERVLGRALNGNRDDWVLATKLGNPAGKGPNEQGISRKWIMQSVEASLKRLGTDYIDILYMHREIPNEPLGEAIRAIADLIRQGKLRYFGVSNFRGWKIADTVRLADELGIDRPVASQPLYNLVTRNAELEQLPAAANYGIGVISYSPLARGVLTGKYEVDAPAPPDSRAGRGDKRIQQTEFRPESLRVAQKIKAHAQAQGISTADFALAWVLNNEYVTSAIVGPRTFEQWQSYLNGLEYQLTEEDEALVDTLVTPGHASTPGYNDPGHPVRGREPRRRG
ncbi:NADP-dependent oxidoreductase [Advenella sp. S44]|uniref:aldo/keto reductase n=1 Tax=Advenella sp. S44 TaxID=1982755 RepID=UPI000C2ABD99|nr:aldo/keto reductase [Advenella sp. S44]PJX25469.1 NADP-dependent oxidoreductase [Advenella sp. S44]